MPKLLSTNAAAESGAWAWLKSKRGIATGKPSQHRRGSYVISRRRSVL